MAGDQTSSSTRLLSPHFEKFNQDYFANYVSSPNRGLKILKGLAFTGCALFCFLLFSSVATHPDWNYVKSSLLSSNASTNAVVPSIPIKTQEDYQKEAIQSLKNTGKPLYYTVHTNEAYDIDSAIRNVLELVPDEVYTRALTKPIVSAGEERMLELGLRVRLFKKYFEAWESLHVVSDPLTKSVLIRDDILRYLRETEDLTAITSKPRAEAIREYETYRTFLSNMSGILFPWTAPYFSDHMTLHGHMYNGGRGIVISGSDEQANYILTAIKSFRALGCNLPVEVMYLGDNDLSQDSRERLEAVEGVATRDLRQMVDDQGWELVGWAGKAFAAFMSSFREVILLDADVLFFDNPELMFEEPGYVDTGALFFRDRVVWPQDKRSFLRKILPKPVSAKVMESRWWKGESGENQESGVVVVDKWRHFLSVFLTARLNGPDRSDSDAGKGTYSFWWGDKETWWIGFELAGDTDYHFHQGDTGNLGKLSNTEPIDAPAKVEEGSFEASQTESDDIKMNVLDTEKIEEEQKNKEAEANNEEHHEDEKATEKDAEEQHSEQETKPEKDSEEGSSSIENKDTADQQNADLQTLESLNEASTDNTRGLSRRHLLTKRDWYGEALAEPRPHLTGSSMLNLPNTNYVLCSPQLLHLSVSGRPLWFNGWIQNNKHEASSQVSTFEFFMAERRKNGDMAEWAVGADNMCCLKSDMLMELSEGEKGALQVIVEIAKEVGALDQVREPERDGEEKDP